jgi:hypothetical protein
MGQYHYIVNLDKRDFIHPHGFGNGLKLCEQIYSHPSTGQALLILLAVSNGRGGGDLGTETGADIIGRWGADRIAMVGDYGEISDLPAEFNADTIYERCVDADTSTGAHFDSLNKWRVENDKPPVAPADRFTDITARVVEVYTANGGGTFDNSGHGWGNWS